MTNLTEEKMTFEQAFQELKSLADGAYFSIAYEIISYAKTSNRDQHLKQSCRVYIDQFNWYNGPTWEISIGLLKEAMETGIKEETINHIPQI